ncbi:MAG: hypothetical protein KC547_10140 [Anaerolineae bacterium]|nr:hypothetical protein [Anaerolineae bacterium]
MAVETVASERTLTRSTIIVFVGFAVAMVISLAQTFLIANVFGIGEQWDAFIAANQIPDAIVRLISGGALTTALIPIFSGLLARDARADAWRLASHVLNTILIASLIASVVAFVAAPTLVSTWVAPGLPPAALAEAVSLMRILLIATVIFAVSGTAMGLLQSHNRFLAPAIAPILFDLGILFGAGFLVKPFGVQGIAYGSVIGAVLHLGVQIPALIRVGARDVIAPRARATSSRLELARRHRAARCVSECSHNARRRLERRALSQELESQPPVCASAPRARRA